MTEDEQKKELEAEKKRMMNFCSSVLVGKTRTHPKKKTDKSTQIDMVSKKIQKTTNLSSNNKALMKPGTKSIIPKSIFFISLIPNPTTFQGKTPLIAIDCEMVVCSDTQRHIARISIVNYNRHTLFDELVKPVLPIKNYLNHITNIDSFKLQAALSLAEYLPKIAEILKGSIVVGHTLECDFEALKLEHDEKLKRDISEFSFFKNEKFKIGLKELTERYLNMKIQNGKHSSVEDARAALELYKLYKDDIDREFKDRYFKKGKTKECEKSFQ